MIKDLNTDNNKPIHYIYHLSDIYIHCDKRHDEYKIIFQSFLNKIKNENSVVIITGNLLKTKNRITSKEIILARDFIFNISQICPLIIIPGSNDKHENIKAILSSGNISLQNINYLTLQGYYSLNNILFTYVTEQNTPKIEKQYEYNICLYHGIVEKCNLYNGKHISSKKMLLENFINYDYVLLGGINKTQFIDTRKKIAYAGSMIQQDYLEDWGDHGYMLWDLKNNKIIHNSLYNTYRFVTLKIIDGKLMTPLDELPYNLYIKWDITESGSGMENLINQIQNNIRKDFNVEEEIYVHNSFSKNIPILNDNKYIFDLSIPKQKEYALNWHTSEGTILNEEHKKELETIIDKYNKKIKLNESPYIKWKLLDLEFENILCYSEKQKINFNNLKGINGIIAQNNAGKSALFDILSFSLFGKTTRTDIYSYNDLVYSSESEEKRNILSIIRVEDIITNDIYTIKREMNSKSIVVTIEKNGIVIHNGSTRDGNTYITSLLGTYDDFMTITFMAQNNIHNFLMMTGKIQKEFTTRIFKLEIYDKFNKIAKDDIKKIKLNIKNVENKINNLNENELKENNKKLSELLLTYISDKNSIRKQTLEKQKEKEKLMLEINPLIMDTCSETLQQLKDNNIKIINDIKIIKENLVKDWDCDEKEKKILEQKIINLTEKNINEKELNNKWKEIYEIINKLKEARSKKVKNELKKYSYEKTIKEINKNINLAEDFINQYKPNTINNTEEQLKNLKEEVFELINNKQKEKIYINLERIKDKFKIKDNILNNLNTLLKEKENYIISLKEKLKKYNVKDNLSIDNFDFNIEQIKKYEISLETIKQKLNIIQLSKKQLQEYKYNPECKYCCNNKFILDAKDKIKDENELIENKTNILKNLNDINNIVKKQKELKIKLDILNKIEENNENIINIKTAIIEFKEQQDINKNNSNLDNIIYENNNKIKELTKTIKTEKSSKIVEEHLLHLKTLKKQYNEIYSKIQEDIKYNITIKEKKDLINKKLEKVINYIEKKNNIQKLNISIKDNEEKIKIKENNIEINNNNNNIKKSLILLSDIIENNNTKIINIIKKESNLEYDIKNNKNILNEYLENKKIYNDLQEKLIILNYFINMTHHNGIPSYLLKKVTNLLQDNVNIILSEYSTMKVKIKNEGKELIIKILNNQNKNFLNAKMLCGSEKFLVELAFRIAFQSLSNISKPNFFICDEGWSCLDEKTRSKLDCILKTLLEYNDYILTVSHINDVKKWMNNHIKIIIDDNNCRHIKY